MKSLRRGGNGRLGVILFEDDRKYDECGLLSGMDDDDDDEEEGGGSCSSCRGGRGNR